MGPLLAGIVILLLVYLLAVPYALWVIGNIVGVVLVLYGIWLLIPRGPRPADGRRVRWY